MLLPSLLLLPSALHAGLAICNSFQMADLLLITVSILDVLWAAVSTKCTLR